MTHGHISGVNNALLQAMAIQLAMQTEEGKLNPVEFIDQLLEKIKPFEEGLFDEDGSDSQMQDSQMSVTSAHRLSVIGLLD